MNIPMPVIQGIVALTVVLLFYFGVMRPALEKIRTAAVESQAATRRLGELVPKVEFIFGKVETLPKVIGQMEENAAARTNQLGRALLTLHRRLELVGRVLSEMKDGVRLQPASLFGPGDSSGDEMGAREEHIQALIDSGSDRSQAEKQVEEEEELFRGLMERMNQG